MEFKEAHILLLGLDSHIQTKNCSRIIMDDTD